MFLLFFFNDTATTEIYTLSLHDALPIWRKHCRREPLFACDKWIFEGADDLPTDAPVSGGDRKSTRLNSSHANISYAVFCLKKKKKETERSSRARTTNANQRHMAACKNR